MPRRTTVTTIFFIFCSLLLLDFASAVVAQTDYTFRIKMIKPRLSADRTYEDIHIKVFFTIFSRIDFILWNKTDEPIEIDWSRASYVDTGGTAHRVIHEGVRFIERDKALAPTIIPPKANITDLVHPADFVVYDSDNIKWEIKDLFLPSIREHLNTPFGVLLPIKIKGLTKNYYFAFRIEKEAIPPEQLALRRKQVEIAESTMNQADVSREQYGALWPFTVDRGILGCSGSKGLGAVIFISEGKAYALNGMAHGKNFKGKPLSLDIDEIRDKGKSLMGFIDRSQELCK